jgi:prepilin-type N-terminal cleavage/methylation domain-containing protein
VNESDFVMFEENLMKTKKAFTLVELLIVVLIIGALAAIAIPRIGTSAANAKINACKTNVDTINSQIELYMANEGVWPAALTDVTADTDYFPDGEPNCPFATAYVYNGTTNRVDEHTH